METPREPDLTGQHGRAWEIKKEGRDLRPDAQACLAAWLLQRPEAHPFWDQWVVSCVHLREIPGAAPPRKEKPENDHEFVIFALNPQAHPEPNPDAERFSYLQPCDLVYQCAGLTDAQAADICKLMVEHILHGGASPDSDWRRWWENSLASTVKHYIERVHDER